MSREGFREAGEEIDAAEFWSDARDLTEIKFYIDGVNVLPTSVLKLHAATGPVFPIVHLEKTSAATTRQQNTDEWMRQLLDWLNGVSARLDPAVWSDLIGADHFVLRRTSEEETSEEE